MGNIKVDSSEDDSKDNSEKAEHSLTNAVQAVILSEGIKQENFWKRPLFEQYSTSF